MQTVEGDRNVALVDGVGQRPRRQRTLVAQIRTDVVATESRPAPEGGHQRLDEAAQPADVLTEVRSQQIASGRVELQTRLIEMLAQPRLRVATRRGLDPAALSE